MAPALFRLLADSAVSRAALGACGFPVALVDARDKQDQNAAQMFAEAPARVEMSARRKDASAAKVELTIGMVHDAEGALSHWVLAFADRSEIERLREELRVLRSLASVP